MDIKARIKELLKTEKLPNGKRTSLRNIAEFLAKEKHTYILHGKTHIYEEGGIYNLIRKVRLAEEMYISTSSPSKQRGLDGMDFGDLYDAIGEGIEEDLPDYVIGQGDYKALLINDVHIPYHKLDVLKIALEVAKEERVNKIILNGDIFDFYGVSRWDRRPDRKLIKEELELGKKFTNHLRKMFPSEEIIFKVGNHEDRLQQYIMKRAPELYGLDCITIPELLDMKNLGFKYVGSTQFIQAGALTVIHGHELMNSGAVVNVSRTKRLKAQDNIIFGHHHRTQSDFGTSIKGKTHGSWAVGCLCGLRPAYFTEGFMNWNHGFAIIDVKLNGSFTVHNRKIINGSVH